MADEETKENNEALLRACLQAIRSRTGEQPRARRIVVALSIVLAAIAQEQRVGHPTNSVLAVACGIVQKFLENEAEA